ncbi:MAG: hypothetical protein JNK53_03050 [Phycisphaerae bacterium]|nr:hypothetical protein [Phycisphaerae bacterium]
MAGALASPRGRRLLRTAVVLLVLGAAGALGVWRALGAAPAWWNHAPDTGEAALRVARGLEQGVAAELTRVRGPGVQAWRVRLRADDVNAWFAARLPQWLEHDRSLKWPAEVGTPQMHIADERVVLAAEHAGRIASTLWKIELGGGAGIAAGDVVAVGGRQAAQLVPDGARLGVMPVPFTNTVGGWFVPELAASLHLEVHLGDGRTVRVVGAEWGDNEVILDCETIAPGGQ